MKRLCVFCGSSDGTRPDYLAAATEVGEALAQRGFELVYGGARVGLMRAVADAAMAAGGTAIGVIPDALVAREVAHEGLTELRIVSSMHERKAVMADLADGFLALPGGFGTLEEYCEILTWAQLGLHGKPCGILNIAGYYDPLLALFDRFVAEGFVRSDSLPMVLVEHNVAALLDRMTRYRSPLRPRVIEGDER